MHNKLECSEDAILQEDLDLIAQTDLPWNRLKNRSILITGATGLVGSQLVRALLAANRLNGCNIRILALVRSAEKAKRVFGSLMDCPELELVYGDVTAPIQTEADIDYIVHLASQTASKEFVTHPVETIDTSFLGTKHILELARQKQSCSVVYVSSMEVYGNPYWNNRRTQEGELGFIDNLKIRSCYSEGKRICECLCACYMAEYGVPVKIARLAQTFGAGVSSKETRVFAQFARSAMEGHDIVLHTKGLSVGNYCYTADAVCGLLTILLDGKDGEAYNVVSEETTMRIAEMAQLVADRIAGGRIQVVFDIPEDSLLYGYAPDVELRLSGKKLMELGWKPRIAPNLETMYRRMISSFEAQDAIYHS